MDKEAEHNNKKWSP